jgi:hypothetical protein
MKTTERTVERNGDIRLQYEKPALRVFGSVAALTAQLTRDMGAMDGGPNNVKT